MIESTTQSYTTRRTLTMVKNERMGGFIPKWETIMVPNTESQTSIAQNITTAIKKSDHPKQIDNVNTLLSYHDNKTTLKDTNIPTNTDNSFEFSDLIDMVNPLHHIPIAGHIYREITGDTIKPIGKIIGAAAFGGPIGAGIALINTIFTQETGQDITDNMMNFTFNRQKNSVPQNPINTNIQDADLTNTLLAFSDPTKSI